MDLMDLMDLMGLMGLMGLMDLMDLMDDGWAMRTHVDFDVEELGGRCRSVTGREPRGGALTAMTRSLSQVRPRHHKQRRGKG